MAKKLEKKGVPAYMVTLGDMWSLMLTFFIMLFAMSEVDATKFRKIQGTLKSTFGFNQKNVNWGPPPGVNVISQSASAANSGSEVMFDQPSNNTIMDPQLAALKMEACERQMKKDVVDKTAAKKNGVVVRKVLDPEIKTGIFEFAEDGKEVSLQFSGDDAFSGNQLNVDLRRALVKLGVALGATQGTVMVRSFMPSQYKGGNVKSAFEESSLRTSAISAAILDSKKINIDRLQMESMVNTRAPSSIKQKSDSVSMPYYSITVLKD